ncbi:hypothetical protein BJ122_11085 [Rhodopseudomonas faecalis]|uniref:Uncharacterized protein n=1 Tax=Rhodopseudomonas faecalis TaxID=99655 RepID=A0A318TI44_9BRAD|nr:hypothetical protein [Rhodopseudomonas faecalis]PYF02748.1 hypothetical protein BJ122_11085 [Rhodopseudomonas faecalis]TAH67275.1 MAG: hypothetical protein EWM45_08025 [Rhodopseudomonas palustris]
MTQITRLYDSTRQIPSIETELKNNGYRYAVVTSAQPSNGATLDDSILAALGRAGVSRGEQAACLDAIKRGGALVSVNASFGFGAKASALLDKFGPGKITATSSASVNADDEDCKAAPFSKIVRAPVLLDTSGEYKSYSGTPLLLDSKKFLSGTPLVLKGDKFFSGTPLLLDSSGPYKSFSGTPLLIDDKKYYSGTPLLLNNPTPLSSWLGLPVLLK